MLGHLHPHRRQVKHLPPLHAHLRRARQLRAALVAWARLVPQRLVRVDDLLQSRPGCPCCPPGLRPLLRRNDFSAGLANGEFAVGGFDEFREFCPNCRLSSATSASSCSIRAVWAATRAASSSYDGRQPAGTTMISDQPQDQRDALDGT
jgi:hypothetical protein